MPEQIRHRGFTLVELVTVAAVVLMVSALVAPAVQQAREAARSTQCRNNLKMLAIGLHNYHDIYYCFPPGWVSREVNGLSTQGYGWMSMALLFFDEAALYNRLDFDGGQLSELTRDRREAAMTPIAKFRCPSDTTPELNHFRGGWPTSNYSGNYGHHPFPRWLAGHGTDFWPGGVAAVMQPHPREKQRPAPHIPTGIFAINSYVGLRQITDGSSNTILVGERGVTSAAGIWPGVTAAVHENDQLTDGSHASRPQSSLRSWSSQHDGVNILLADGAVREISAQINSLPNGDPKQPMGVFQKLAARNDNQITDF